MRTSLVTERARDGRRERLRAPRHRVPLRPRYPRRIQSVVATPACCGECRCSLSASPGEVTPDGERGCLARQSRATSRQNSRSTSRRCDGAPGDFNGDRPVNSVIVLRRPAESDQYSSAEFARWCSARRVHTSMGHTGVCWDNPAAESFFATLKERDVPPARVRDARPSTSRCSTTETGSTRRWATARPPKSSPSTDNAHPSRPDHRDLVQQD